MDEIRKLKLKRIGNKIQIVEQSHREKEFSEIGRNRFTASNGYEIISASLPDMCTNILYVQGDNEQEDDLEPTIYSEREYDKLKLAIREYNKLLEYKTIEER
jgi:hypothetical protein